MNAIPEPIYPLKDVKKLIHKNNVFINQNALSDAIDDFGWGPGKIKKCLLKLNDKYYSIDQNKNHFHKTAPHHKFPRTMMDFYKAKNIMEGASVYTHIYIDPGSGMLIVSSFKEL